MTRAALLAMSVGVAACGGAAPVATTTPGNTGGGDGEKGEPPTLTCTAQREDYAIEVDAARAAIRRGHGDQKFSDRRSSPDQPIEVCGYAQQYAWLARMACDDGTHPVADRGDTSATRGSTAVPIDDCLVMMDVWTVPCPEAEYTVVINQYVCTPDEGVMDNWG